MFVATNMTFNTDTFPADAADPMGNAALVTVQVSGQDIARQLLAIREAARTAGLAKVVVCLDYAYYEAVGNDGRDEAESAEIL